jgi:hypothetical protein
MMESLFQFEPRNCVLCGCLCQPAPTNRGWVYVDNEAFRGGVHYDCLYHWWDNVRASGEPDAVVDALQAEIERLRQTLLEIRDLARTGLAPSALNMTEDQWDRHRLNRIAREANAALEKQRGEG